MSLESSPFAALSLIVAPAILTNASSVLIMSTSNRLARAIDRARELAREIEDCNDAADPDATRRMSELGTAVARSLLLVQAIRSCYVALSGFAAAALLSLLGAVLLAAAPPLLGKLLEATALLAGLIGVGSLIHASVSLVREAQHAVGVLQTRAADLRARPTSTEKHTG